MLDKKEKSVIDLVKSYFYFERHPKKRILIE